MLARLLALGALPSGSGRASRFQLAYPGDFGYALDDGGPALATWVAALRRRRRARGRALLPRRLAGLDRMGPIAAATAALAILPVALHGFTHWDERPTAARGLTPGLVRALRDRVPRRRSCSPTTRPATRSPPSHPSTSRTRLPGHVADTKANRPYARRDDARQFFRTGDLAIPRRYGATWLVVDRNRSKLRPDLPQVYPDPRYVLYRLNVVKVLLVSMYFPPAGGGGVQRTLKTATHLPGLGIETHVLAPDDPKWVHRDDELQPPTQAWVHRARYVGPSGRLPAEELHGKQGSSGSASRRGSSAGACSSPTRTSPGT